MEIKKMHCPNCGALVTVPPNKTKVTCEYCKKHLLIEKDHDEILKLISDFSQDITTYQRSTIELVESTEKIFSQIGIIIGILIIIGIAFFCVKQELAQIPKDRVTDFSQLTESKISDIHNVSIKRILNQDISGVKEISKMELYPYGMYLLVSKTGGEPSELYDVYKSVKIVDGEEIILYCAIAFHNIQKEQPIDSRKMNIYDTSEEYTITLKNGNKATLYGFETPEDLYNKIIRHKTGNYKVLITEGIYVEK